MSLKKYVHMFVHIYVHIALPFQNKTNSKLLGACNKIIRQYNNSQFIFLIK